MRSKKIASKQTEFLLQGLCYLHLTYGPHGCLRPHCCLIDDRFSLKISQTAFQEIRNLAKKSNEPFHNKRWIAPEYTNETRFRKSVPADVYAYSLVLTTIYSSQMPFVKAHEERSFLPNRDPHMLDLIASCAAIDPEKRPSMEGVKRRMKEIPSMRSLSARTFAQRIIERFEVYTGKLEAAVEIRTQELRNEQNRCDDILLQMLPPYVSF